MVPSSSLENKTEDGVEKLLAKVGIVDAMSSAKDENMAETNMSTDFNDDDSDDDGWAAEDNEWDEIAKEREVAARKAVRVRAKVQNPSVAHHF